MFTGPAVRTRGFRVNMETGLRRVLELD